MNKFPEFLRIPLSDWIDAIMDWLLTQFGAFFDAIGHILLVVLLYIERFFLWLPWWAAILLVGLISWRIMRSWWMGIIMAGLLVLIGSFGYWELSMMTLGLTTAAVVVSLAVGIPVGITMAKSDLVESIIRPILDAMQTMPSFVYLIPALMLFGLGKVPALFATLIYSVPPVIRLTNVGIRQVSEEVIEAARAFGASPRQILFDVQMPLAVPSIMVGINQTTMMALAMVVIASMIGARGLGLEVLLAINRIEVGRGFEAGISIVFLAIIIDRLTHALAARQKKTMSA
ncbi:MAG: ABC transporter permease [Thermodesulfobacteriota bacterium]